MQKDCRTCTFRTMPDDVDFTKTPCDHCSHLHVTNSQEPWPMWSQRTPLQFQMDADAGHKVRVKMISVTYEKDGV